MGWRRGSSPEALIIQHADCMDILYVEPAKVFLHFILAYSTHINKSRARVSPANMRKLGWASRCFHAPAPLCTESTCEGTVHKTSVSMILQSFKLLTILLKPKGTILLKPKCMHNPACTLAACRISFQILYNP